MTVRRFMPHGTAVLAGLACALATEGAAPPNPAQIRWHRHKLVQNLSEACAIADVDNDGRLDVISGPLWFQAPTWEPRPLRDVEIGNEEFFTTNGDHAFDLNGDGWVDVITASWFSDKLFWYENPGAEGLRAGRKWKEHVILDGQGQCEGTIVTDMDGDGTADLIPNSWNAERAAVIVRIRPGKDGQAPRFEPHRLGGPGYGHGLGAGDVNGDGRTDLLVNKGWYEQPAAGAWSGPWPFHGDFDFAHTSLPWLVLDLNGDGRNDLVIGHGHDYGLAWYEQGEPKEGKTTWIRHEIDRSFSQVHSLTWTDLDGDGRGEILTGKRWRAHGDGDPGAKDPQCLLRFEWDPIGKTFTKDVLSYGGWVGTGMQIRVADLDGDRRPDVAVGGKGGGYILFQRGPAREDQRANR